MNSNQRIKRYGFTRVLQAAITRRLEQYVNLHLWAILTRPVISHYELPEAHAKNFEFRRLSLEDLLLAADNPELHLSKQFVRNALERGDICVGAFKKKQLIGYTWRSLTRAPITDKLWIRIDSRPQRYGYKA
ncbi:MAG: hypothetical protein KUG75_01340, partial [Pseudomonadales bacterium]|nr:hypothetical protein [Pseudomonadales bacterium]